MKKKQRLLIGTLLASGYLMAGTAQANLVGRDLDGTAATYEAYYDTDRDISWFADAGASGALTWANAMSWAGSLDVSGITGWRLPTTSLIDPGCSRQAHLDGTGCSASEMGHLGIIEGISLATPGGLINLADDWYWSSTRPGQPLLDPEAAYVFYFGTESQSGDWADPKPALGIFTASQHHALAVHEGDVGLLVADPGPGGDVPEPGSGTLTLSAIALLATVRRGQRA